MNRLKKHFQNVLETKTSSHSIAFGFALGSFIALLPTPGFSILIALFIIVFFKNISKYSLLISLAFWNPIVQAPLYLLSYRIGDLLFADAEVIRFKLVFVNQVFNFTRGYLVGNAIIATSLSLFSYVLIRFSVDFFRKKNGNNHLS